MSVVPKPWTLSFVLQRECRTCKTLFLVGSILPNEEPVDVVVREILEETGLTLTFDDFTLLSDAPVRVALHGGRRPLVYVFSADVPVPCVTSNLRTLANLEQVVNANRPLIHLVLTSYHQRLALTVFRLH
jgi:8-oxo-dGTP pyrophosphatase MutT (NUDIX family)